MKYLSIDLETYSPLNLSKTGVYPYSAHPDFQILLFGYAIDEQPVQVVDLASGEKLPNEILVALVNPGWSSGRSTHPSNASASHLGYTATTQKCCREASFWIRVSGAAPWYGLHILGCR